MERQKPDRKRTKASLEKDAGSGVPCARKEADGMVKTDAEKARRTIPSIFHDPEKVTAAVAQAKRTAQEKAVPLTLSRLADCLGVEGEELYTFLEGRGGGPAVREVRRRLRLVRQGCRT